MSEGKKYDIVLYGVTGFTGAYILEVLSTCSKIKEGGFTVAVAGRSENKIREVLDRAAQRTKLPLGDVPVIVASTEDPESLDRMCKQAKIVINAVGPYRLHGEAVVKAAVENGAHYLDICGEPAFIEKMEAKYRDQAKEKGVFVVSACGWDSIPCDLGVHALKKQFEGDLSFAETFVQIQYGDAGYSFNAGTYQTLILGISGAATDGLGKIRKAIMPNRPPTGKKPPKRGNLWKIDQAPVEGWALPFMGADRSIVNRSQYYDYHVKQKRPVIVETYVRVGSIIWAFLLAAWLTIFSILAQYSFTKKIR